MNIEKEIQSRVEFKIQEILSSVENIAKANWNIAFQNNSQKHSHYWEAFEQMKQMMIKEAQSPTPYNDMSEHKRRNKKDNAVDVIMDRFCKRGEKDYIHKKTLLASIIEDAQNW